MGRRRTRKFLQPRKWRDIRSGICTAACFSADEPEKLLHTTSNLFRSRRAANCVSNRSPKFQRIGFAMVKPRRERKKALIGMLRAQRSSLDSGQHCYTQVLLPWGRFHAHSGAVIYVSCTESWQGIVPRPGFSSAVIAEPKSVNA